MTTPHRVMLEPTNLPADVKDRSRRVRTRRDLLKAAMRMYFAERSEMAKAVDTFWRGLPRVSITELAVLSRLSEFELRELVEYGALEPQSRKRPIGHSVPIACCRYERRANCATISRSIRTTSPLRLCFLTK
jgi:hypothetical protein